MLRQTFATLPGATGILSMDEQWPHSPPPRGGSDSSTGKPPWKRQRWHRVRLAIQALHLLDHRTPKGLGPMRFRRRSNSHLFGNALEAKSQSLTSPRARGLKLLCRNYRSRFGEIDLNHERTPAHWCSLRCRYRRSRAIRWRCRLGHRSAKQTPHSPYRGPLLYRRIRGLQHCPCRFDVLGLSQCAPAGARITSDRLHCASTGLKTHSV